MTTALGKLDFRASFRKGAQEDLSQTNLLGNRKALDYTYIKKQVDDCFCTRNLVLAILLIEIVDKVIPLSMKIFGLGWFFSIGCYLFFLVGFYIIMKPVFIIAKDFFILAYAIHNGETVPENPYTQQFFISRLFPEEEPGLSEALV